jgi:diguanylate cyclase
LHVNPAVTLRHLGRWLAPKAPAAIRVDVEQRQVMRLRAQLPMLYMISSLNVVLVMVVCAHKDVPIHLYGWLSVFIAVAVARVLRWRRLPESLLNPEDTSQRLRRSFWLGTVALGVLGLFTAYTFVRATFDQTMLMPISLAFGSMSIAHCFATLRPIAVGATILGIVVPSIAVLAAGNFDAQVLAVIMLSVAVLMIQFVSGQYSQLVTEVKLQREVYDLANTDALTNLPNRRAVMRQIAAELSIAGNVFAVALLDLDGFKAINDRLGHLAGDALLQHAAKQLIVGHVLTDSVGRLGGDEFLAIFRAPRDRADVDDRAAALTTALSQPVTIESEAIVVRASMGCALYPADGATLSALLAAADAALYAIKRSRTPVPLARTNSADRRQRRSLESA